MGQRIKLTLKVWRQKDMHSQGRFEIYKAEGIDTDMSFLEMLDIVNERLTKQGVDPIAFDHDCREGICGTCGAVVNGQPHGPLRTHIRWNNFQIPLYPFDGPYSVPVFCFQSLPVAILLSG